MKTEHKYAQALRWIADGENLQLSHPEILAWQDLTRLSQPTLSSFFAGEDDWEFRIKPRTVKIGNREVEAPVLDPAEGQRLWFVGSDGEAYANTPKMLEFDIASGRAFATKEAATAAHDAITALLRGEA